MPVLLEDTLLRLMPEICEAHNVAQVAIRPVVQECLKETQVLARFHGAVNCASPSPCGRWVAVLTDSMTVTVLPEALDYKTRCGMLLRWPDVGRYATVLPLCEGLICQSSRCVLSMAECIYNMSRTLCSLQLSAWECA